MNKKSIKEKPKKDYGKLQRRGECLYRNSLSGIFYFVGAVNGTRHTLSLGTTDLATARRELLKRRALLGDRKISTVKISLAEWIERYRRTFQHLAPATVVGKELISKRILEDWPTGRSTPLDVIRPSDCSLWLSQYKFGIVSRNEYRWLLRDLFQGAVQDGLIQANPAEHLQAEKRPTPLRLTPTFEQFQQIVACVRGLTYTHRDPAESADSGSGLPDAPLRELTAAEKDRCEASADFLEAEGLLGLGQAELGAMTRQDVDLEHRKIAVKRHKTGGRFVIPIYPMAQELISRLCEGKRHSQPLFAIKNAKKSLRGACKRLDLPPFSQRSLRRMFITCAIENGVDVKVIAQWQNHKDGGKLILDTYSHVRPVHSDAMAQLELGCQKSRNPVKRPSAWVEKVATPYKGATHNPRRTARNLFWGALSSVFIKIVSLGILIGFGSCVLIVQLEFNCASNNIFYIRRWFSLCVVPISKLRG